MLQARDPDPGCLQVDIATRIATASASEIRALVCASVAVSRNKRQVSRGSKRCARALEVDLGHGVPDEFLAERIGHRRLTPQVLVLPIWRYLT